MTLSSANLGVRMDERNGHVIIKLETRNSAKVNAITSSGRLTLPVGLTPGCFLAKDEGVTLKLDLLGEGPHWIFVAMLDVNERLTFGHLPIFHKEVEGGSDIFLDLTGEVLPHVPSRLWIEDRHKPTPELHAAVQIGRVIYATSEGFARNWDPLPSERVVLISYEGLPQLIKAAHSGRVRGLKKFTDLSARPATYSSYSQLQHQVRTLERQVEELQTENGQLTQKIGDALHNLELERSLEGSPTIEKVITILGGSDETDEL